MHHAPPSPARLALAARREEGFGLIEVLVTAVVILVVGTAVFSGLDAASSASGRTKARSVASTLAQRDQERMRSLEVDELNNMRQTDRRSSCDEDGKACTVYTIDSRTQWVSDTTGTASCTTTDARADYLQLISTVSWPNMRGSKPVVMKSIYSPPVGSFGPSQGSLAVKLVGADGVTPKPGVTVRLTGPRTFTDQTNVLGCVVWGYLPAGSGYTIAMDEPGYVDPQGVRAVSSPASVIGEALTTKTFMYDRASTATVSFFAKLGTVEFAGQKAESITLAHTQMAPSTRSFPLGTPTTASTSLTTLSLFPFKGTSPGGAYRIFAGTCGTQDPANLGDPALISLPDLTPGLGTNFALQMPAIDTRITVNGGAIPDSTHAPKYKVTQTTASCTTAVPAVVTPTPFSPDPNPGRLMEMGRPYGTYTVCAQATIGGTVRREIYSPVTITRIAGVKVPAVTGTIDITSADPAGAC